MSFTSNKRAVAAFKLNQRYRKDAQKPYALQTSKFREFRKRILTSLSLLIILSVNLGPAIQPCNVPSVGKKMCWHRYR
jgi:hypothetical protein